MQVTLPSTKMDVKSGIRLGDIFFLILRHSKCGAEDHSPNHILLFFLDCIYCESSEQISLSPKVKEGREEAVIHQRWTDLWVK